MSKTVLKVIIAIVTIIAIGILGLLKEAGVIRLVSIFGVAIFAIARAAWKAVDKEENNLPKENNETQV